MYQFPKWKYWLVIIVMVTGLVFFLPNVFPPEPALQIVRQGRQQPIDTVAEERIRAVLVAKSLAPSGSYFEDARLVLKFATDEIRQQARNAVIAELGTKEFSIALADAQGGPDFIRKIGLKPMSLGLDLRGGVHLVYEVDVRSSVNQTLERMEREFRTVLREQHIPYTSIATVSDVVRIGLRDPADNAKATAAIRKHDADLQIESLDNGVISVRMTPDQLKQRQSMAIQQNITTLRKRVDELSVSEPIVTQQGQDRIVVQLPGMKDPNEAIRILGTAASVEFRLVDETNDPNEADRTKRIPISSKLYKVRESGRPILVKRELIASGDQLTDASSSFQDGRPAVNVKLNGQAGSEMLKTTQQNLGHAMAVVYIQKKQLSEGESCAGTRMGNDCTEEDVISDARINGIFSTNFQITGLAAAEAKDLALLLRAGSLATPLKLIGQRTVGPSLGQDNIDRGKQALALGLLLTFAFMAIYYRAFGWIANVVLLSNLILTVGLLSMIQASLSLPGIAAVVFHLGIAVDANILIYERIREELRLGNSPQAAINAGFEKAFATIADSNVTTLIAGVVLMALGSGTILSFAIVMTLGILTSLFTSVVGSRALVHFIWGRRKRIESLSI